MTFARPSLRGVTIRGWTDDRLDALLADPDVRAAAESVLLDGYDRRGVWRVSRVYAACRQRYRRAEPGRLLFDLAYRLMQTLNATEAGQPLSARP